MKKKTIHFNDETLKEIDELIGMLGVRGYGDIPKALKFSVTFTIQALKREAEVLPSLNHPDLDLYAASIRKIAAQRNREIEAEKILKRDDK